MVQGIGSLVVYACAFVVFPITARATAQTADDLRGVEVAAAVFVRASLPTGVLKIDPRT